MSQWQWTLVRLTRQLWLRATLIGTLGVLAALAATTADRLGDLSIPFDIGADAISGVLNIIATSMLAVTTFSLSIMTAAYASATSNATPRATRLLIEDRITQNALSTFVGSFLFGIVGIVVLKVGAYGERGRAILFLVTVVVIALIVYALLRWIDHLTTLGRVGETADRVEKASRRALADRMRQPCLGAAPLGDDTMPEDAVPVRSETVGYIQHIDVELLTGLAAKLERALYIPLLPGAFVYAGTVLARVEGSAGLEEPVAANICKAFTIGNERSFDQDPRFGLEVLSEIACRALSPAINDHGTAIDVIGRATRLLTDWATGIEEQETPEPDGPGVYARAIRASDLFDDAFMLIARDGAAMIEIQLRLRKSLLALGEIGNAEFRAAARQQADMALQRAKDGLTSDVDKRRLADVQG